MKQGSNHPAALPGELRGKCYIVTPVGSSMRIDPHATATFELALPLGALP